VPEFHDGKVCDRTTTRAFVNPESFSRLQKYARDGIVRRLFNRFLLFRREARSNLNPAQQSQRDGTNETVAGDDLRRVALQESDAHFLGIMLNSHHGRTVANLVRELRGKPDGNFLYYASGGASTRNRVLYKMPVLGGASRKVVEDVSSPISFSPDGKQIAFARNGNQGSELMIANADGTEERMIAIRKPGGSFGNLFEGGTAWSPDGKRIVSIAISSANNRGFMNVVEVPVEGGTERSITSQKWNGIQRLAWLADGSGLLMTAAEQAEDFQATQIWHLAYPSGEARKITNDLKEYRNISLNADSSVLVTLQGDRDANIWVAPNGDASRATQLTSPSSMMDGANGIAWTPDGKIVYYSLVGDKDGIWMMEADGKNRDN